MNPIHAILASISARWQEQQPMLNAGRYARYIPLCSLLFASCSPLRSTRWEEGAPQPGRNAGQAYYLPKAVIRIVGHETLFAQNPDKRTYTIQLSTEMLPDRQHRHYAWHTGHWLYEDAVILQVNAAGLLEAQQKADAKDKLPDSIVSVGKSAVYAWQIYSSLSPADAMKIQEIRKEPIKPLPFDISFDPTDTREFERAKKDLYRAGFILNIAPMPYEETTTDSAAIKGINKRDNGLFYRPMTTITLEISSRPDVRKEDLIFSRTTSLAIPNPKEIAILTVKRMPFGDMAQQGNFTGGNPNKLEITQPSPILGVVQIPEKILGAAAGAIGGVFDNRSKARTDEKQRQLFDAELALAKAENEKKLADAQLQALQAQAALMAVQQNGTTRSANGRKGVELQGTETGDDATLPNKVQKMKQKVAEIHEMLSDLEKEVEKKESTPENDN